MDLKERLQSEFLPAVLHGDEAHRAWLTKAVECFIAGAPIPSVKGKGSADTIAALERKLEVAREGLATAEMYLRTGFLDCDRCGDETLTHNLDATYELQETMKQLGIERISDE